MTTASGESSERSVAQALLQYGSDRCGPVDTRERRVALGFLLVVNLENAKTLDETEVWAERAHRGPEGIVRMTCSDPDALFLGALGNSNSTKSRTGHIRPDVIIHAIASLGCRSHTM